MTRSEGSITVFQNGHHKPVHRKNNAAHECGMPYKVPMPRSHTDTGVAKAARRSVDSLNLDNNMTFESSACASYTNVPFNTERRLSKSEHASPRMSGLREGGPVMDGNHFSAIDFSTLAPSQSNQSLPSAASDAYFPTFDPMSGVDGSFDPWSNLPSGESISMPNNNPFGVWPTNNDSGNLVQPALTAASSGTQSEIEDEIPPMDDVYGFGMPSIQEDAGNFNFNEFNAPGSPQANRRSLPPNFLSSVFKSSDAMVPAPDGGDWQPSNMDFTDMNEWKPKQYDNNQAMSFDNSWQMPSSNNVAQRALGGLPITGRPSSHSIGHTSAPNDELIQQLFPGIDFDGTTFGFSTSPQNFTTSNGVNDKMMTSADITSTPTDFGPMDESVGFTSQPGPTAP